VGSILKGIDKLVGIDDDAAVKAGKAQAAATTAAAADQAREAQYAAQAASQQMQTAAQARAEQAQANDLLSKPIQNADVDLATNPDDLSAEDDDLLSKRRGVRASYQSPTRSSGLVV